MVSMFVIVLAADFLLSMLRVLDRIYLLIPKKEFPQVPFDPHLKKCLYLMTGLNLHCSRFSDLCSKFLPGLMVVGCLLIVNCNYNLIKLFGKISIAAYLVFLSLTIIGTSIVLFCYSAAAFSFENTLKIKSQIAAAAKTKWLISKIRSVRPARISVGDCYYLKTNTKCTYLESMVKSTLDAVLAF